MANRPSLDQLSNTLTNHALMDRKGSSENIGFVNDFIFGTFIGENILDEKRIFSNISKHMIELATTSFQFQSNNKKQLLYDKITSTSSFSNQERLINEYLLRNEISENYKDATFNDFALTEVVFSIQNQFEQCVFANCTFEKCTLNNNSFYETSFVNCIFIDCEYIKEASEGSNIFTLNCNDYGCGFVEKIQCVLNDLIENETLPELILKKFLNSSNRPKHKKLSSILNELSSDQRIGASKAMNKLKSEKFIRVNGDDACLTESGFQEAIKL
jgi:uncharacterized protein YjbI with pentapeptide repeats